MTFPGATRQLHRGNGGGGGLRALIEARLRVVRVMHFAFLMSLVFYAVLVHVLRAVLGTFSGVGVSASIQPIRGLLYAVGVLAVGAVLVLKPRLLSAEGPGQSGGETDFLRVLRLLQARQIVLMALAEVAAICGLLLTLLGGAPTDFYLLGALSLLGLLAVIPRRDLWERLARRSVP